jgi:hypothetical protein
MPHVRKLTPAEAAAEKQRSPGSRAALAQAYDELLIGFAVGDYGRAELHAGERRDTVRRQLQAAARRRGLALRFRSGPGPLTFRVEAAPAAASPVPAEEPVASPRVEAQRGVGARPPRRRQPAGRYDDVLPRWMREGQPPGRRGESKRR